MDMYASYFSSHCLLYEFLEDYVVNTFLESVADEMTSKLEAAIKGTRRM